MSRRAQHLVFTLFGEYLRQREPPVWVGSLITLLRPFDLSEAGVRTALSRMSRRGWLEAERSGRHAFYRLTPRGRTLLEEGADRIFRPRDDAPWDGRWSLVAYSIPEERRHLRDRLRVRLAWLGFGSLGNGLWISPWDVTGPVRTLADELGVDGHLECFRACHVGDEPRALVRAAWDLDALQARYGDFVDRWRGRLEDCRRRAGRDGLDPARAYALRFELIHEFRAFPLDDPRLPRPLLPERWRGEEAAEIVGELHALCSGPADAWVDHVLADAPHP